MDLLTRKFGPLPAWGWAAVTVGAFVLYRWRKSKAASSSSQGVGQIPISSPNLDVSGQPDTSGQGVPLSPIPIPTSAMGLTNGNGVGGGSPIILQDPFPPIPTAANASGTGPAVFGHLPSTAINPLPLGPGGQQRVQLHR